MPRACWPYVLLAIFLLVAPAAWGAESYPARPIRFLVPFGPGGVGDITARVVAQKMGELLGQQVITDNRPGAGGIVASQVVAKAEPDGYTILLLNNQHAISMALFKSLPYDTLRDFAPVGSLGTFSLVLMVNPDSPGPSASAARSCTSAPASAARTARATPPPRRATGTPP